MAAEPLKLAAACIDPVQTVRPADYSLVGKNVVGVMAATVLLFAVSTSALACAGGFLQAFLFQKYPEAKAATMAIAEARVRGTLQGDGWSRKSGKSLHAWRTERTMVTIQVLQKQLNSNVTPAALLGGINVFLLNEFTWLSITNEGNRIAVSRRPYGLQMSGPMVFTSRRVLDALLDGTITWQQAVDQGLVTSRCGTDCSSDKRYSLLRPAMGMPKGEA